MFQYKIIFLVSFNISSLHFINCIEFADVTQCRKISDYGMKNIVAKCLKMEKSMMQYCVEISDSIALEIIKYSRKMRHSNISRCKIAEGWLKKLKNHAAEINCRINGWINHICIRKMVQRNIVQFVVFVYTFSEYM